MAETLNDCTAELLGRLAKDCDRLAACAGYAAHFGTPRARDSDRWNGAFSADIRAVLSELSRLQSELEAVKGENERLHDLLARSRRAHDDTLLSRDDRLSSLKEEVREVLGPIAHFVAMFNAKPIRGIDAQTLYGIHHGTEWEADLEWSTLRQAATLYSKLSDGGGEG